jgi:hypothetical protein
MRCDDENSIIYHFRIRDVNEPGDNTGKIFSSRMLIRCAARRDPFDQALGGR